MKLEEIRNLSDEDMKAQEKTIGEQIFRIGFAKSLGKTEGAGKVRSLKVNIARIKTVARERQLAAAKAGKE
jgi:large subunit ribosomal protein L29